MQTKVKHRLIGLAVIVISAAVVFPLFFDGAGYKERHLSSKIPAQPAAPEIVEISPTAQPLPDTSDYPAPLEPIVLPQAEGELAKVIEASKSKNQVVIDFHKDQPVLDQQGVPVAWTLQLASFKSEDNAKELRTQLKAEGYKVFMRKEGSLVKVFVGPELQKSRLESLQTRVKKDFGLSGIIVRFTTQ